MYQKCVWWTGFAQTAGSTGELIQHSPDPLAELKQRGGERGGERGGSGKREGEGKEGRRKGEDHPMSEL